MTTFDDRLAKLARAMFDVMYRTDGIGLAAPQVGANVRVMVYNPTGEPSEADQEVVLVNPKVCVPPLPLSLSLPLPLSPSLSPLSDALTPYSTSSSPPAVRDQEQGPDALRGGLPQLP